MRSSEAATGSRLRTLTSSDGLPERASLPWYLAPVPERLENLGLRLAWAVVVTNLLGTAFGFWYYRAQFGETPTPMWPFLPDSPMATLLFAAAVASWKLGRNRQWLIALAFVGNIVLGAWTPFVLLTFRAEFPVSPPMWQFLFWSHLAMVVQAFVLHRIGDFPPRAIAVAVLWYGTNLVVDYFVPVLGDHPHHTALPVEPEYPVALGASAHDAAGAAALVLVLFAVSVAMATGSAKRRGHETAAKRLD
ncbi:hypothetical protein L593_14045 [Salinarchaeum sp. Harcht-Bsk1]|uniref:DUF1405 domain-containing protein n=1 Tax=Salinarchaeum sp. Harcht-Bsk1 TaxID=1333523 RepID=UPI0003424999|nr:DUF1405 domain-containing protein [Salinarchaeum sp. Harcht-Bsk1]AGN02748.1 hypothetical protein L593_14045 [Salinarchaeum sp. Harcht-Bsk1]